MEVALAARDTSKLTDLVDETGALALNCDASRPDDVKALFDRVEDAFGAPDLVVYNASGRYRAAVEDIEPDKLEDALKVTAFGGFLVAQAAAVRMLARLEIPEHETPIAPQAVPPRCIPQRPMAHTRHAQRRRRCRRGVADGPAVRWTQLASHQSRCRQQRGRVEHGATRAHSSGAEADDAHPHGDCHHHCGGYPDGKTG